MGLALAGVGCSPRNPLGPPQGVLFIGLGVSSDEAFSPDLLGDIQDRFKKLETAYRTLNGKTAIHFHLYPEDQILAAIRHRTWAGLAPDVLMVNGETARELQDAGLIDPFPATPDMLANFDPDEIRRLRSASGDLMGLPMLVQTQLACYNRRKLPVPPATVDDLLALSADGYPIGLPTTLSNLFWSAGSLGAIEGLNEAVAGRRPNLGQRVGIEAWLAWLQNASNHHRVMFFDSQEAAQRQLIDGQLDWIPCRSTQLPLLNRQMGQRLGVAALPGGTKGDQASPINRLRVLSLGRNSSHSGRERALTFSRFVINPMTQRDLTIGSRTFLPANIHVRVPVLSSNVLAAMVTANQQGRNTDEMLSTINSRDPRVTALQSLINQVLFGEVGVDSTTDQVISLLSRRP
jgi:ABC-type glycerol-3-phosphate transport system substrate-binding protein